MNRIKKLLTIATAGLVFSGLELPVRAADEVKEAPLVSGLADLRKLSGQLVALSGPSSAATVSLISTRGNGSGSGVIVSEDGLILTAAHVMDALSGDVIVLFPDGSRKQAKALGGDFDRDAAMVQITEEGSYPHVAVGESADLLRNEWCVALGHPGGYDAMRTPPVRLGRVLDNSQFITTDCAVVGGDSGGPLFDVDGKVIGIHSNIGSTLTENRHVPIEVFLRQWDDLKGGKRVGSRFAGEGRRVDPNRPVLGVNLRGPGPEGGVLLDGVMEKSPAEQAGLKGGDVVTKINGAAVGSAEELIRAVGQFGVGDELKISYRENGEGEEREIEVTLARLGDLLDTAPPRRERRLRRGRGEPRPAEDGTPKGKAAEDAKPAEELKVEEGPKVEEGEAAQTEEKNPLQELLERAKKEGRFELDEEDLRKLGGPEEFERHLEGLLKSLNPEERRRLWELRVGGPDLFFESSIKALAPVTSKLSKSTVAIRIDGKPVALGTVVSKNGFIFTKDTETTGGAVTIEREGKEVPLKLVKRYPRSDLALFEGAGDGWEPVRWADGEETLPIGSLLTAPDSAGQPLGIGLISVQTRALGGEGFLGIQMEAAEDGIRITLTTEGGPARQGGLKRGDLVSAVDGREIADLAEFARVIRGHKPDEEVTLSYRRDGKNAEAVVKLGERPGLEPDVRFRRMNELSGPLSARLTGFPEALQHDIPLSPSECGGPLVDLDGRCVGINVSRAGRVRTLAVPAGAVAKLLAEVGETGAEDAAKEKERERVMKELKEVESQLEKLEKRLEELNAG